VWSLGHRSVQGAAVDPASGRLWTVEHGARGGDELNHPEAGKNYGWPVITYGRNYDLAKIGEGTAKAGMEQPVYYWDPSIATSGLALVQGDRFPGWKGSVLVGGLAGARIARLTLEGGAVVAEEVLLGGQGTRIRDVREGPDGAIYALVDEARGRILRITPAGK
jgi:glucose/arabinose dehydrogenase